MGTETNDGLPIFTVDAFTDTCFQGNPAAVVLSPNNVQELPTKVCLKIASELNLSETAFPVPLDGDFRTAGSFTLKWFTPKVEVPLCGHATLATAHTLFQEIGNINDTISFATQSGTLVVAEDDHSEYLMVFPQYVPLSVKFDGAIGNEQSFDPLLDGPTLQSIRLFVTKLLETSGDSDNLNTIIYSPQSKKLLLHMNWNRENLENYHADFERMLKTSAESPIKGVIITIESTPDDSYDFNSRYFAPWVGINEDPATGSAHCLLGPYWRRVLGEDVLRARQCYPGRGANFLLRLRNDETIEIIGKAVTVIRGSIQI